MRLRERLRYAGGKEVLKEKKGFASCDDGYADTAPVGAFHPNAFGLHDVLGNAWEWVEDCSSDYYIGAPADGSAWNGCESRVYRGGGWFSPPQDLRSARRGMGFMGRHFNVGFRVARTLTP